MKTFAEAFAARGMDDWDIAQAIKKQTRAHTGARPVRGPWQGPNAADMAAWKKQGLTGAALAAAYVKQFEAARNLRQTSPVFEAVGTAAPMPSCAAQTVAEPRPRRTATPKRHGRGACSKNPLDALLGAIHDAHKAQRETRRRAGACHA